MVQKTLYRQQTQQFVKFPTSSLDKEEVQSVHFTSGEKTMLGSGQCLECGIGLPPIRTLGASPMEVESGMLERLGHVAADIGNVDTLKSLQANLENRTSGVDYLTNSSDSFGFPGNFNTDNIFGSGQEEEDGTIDWSLFMFAIVLPILYAGIHLAAWNYDFPSKQERTLWIMSCFYIMFCLIIMGIMSSLGLRGAVRVIENPFKECPTQ
ncbi:hypothetical protein ACMFMF_009061 [Clarireedia jacksonii]